MFFLLWKRFLPLLLWCPLFSIILDASVIKIYITIYNVQSLTNLNNSQSNCVTRFPCLPSLLRFSSNYYLISSIFFLLLTYVINDNISHISGAHYTQVRSGNLYNFSTGSSVRMAWSALKVKVICSNADRLPTRLILWRFGISLMTRVTIVSGKWLFHTTQHLTLILLVTRGGAQLNLYVILSQCYLSLSNFLICV